MKTISGGKQTGKTIKAIELAAKKFAYIICRSQYDAHRIFSLAHKFCLDIPFPITYVEFLNRRGRGRGITGYVFDDAKDFLKYLASDVPIFAAVWTDDDNADEGEKER